MTTPEQQIARRRTFAIISHPDAGKTTLTEKLLLFGGWESASRGAGITLQIVGERLGIADQFQGVDRIDPHEDGSFEVLERVEGGKHQVSVCAGAPAVLGWATGSLGEPRNNPRLPGLRWNLFCPQPRTVITEPHALQSSPRSQRDLSPKPTSTYPPNIPAQWSYLTANS